MTTPQTIIDLDEETSFPPKIDPVAPQADDSFVGADSPKFDS